MLPPGIVGTFVGVIGWLGVGLCIERRQLGRQGRTGARASSLAGILAVQERALAMVARKAFSVHEAAALVSAGGSVGVPAAESPDMQEG